MERCRAYSGTKGFSWCKEVTRVMMVQQGVVGPRGADGSNGAVGVFKVTKRTFKGQRWTSRTYW